MTSSALGNHDRTLRWTVAITWFPAFAFLLAYGIVAEEVIPALAILPMTISVATSFIHLFGRSTHLPGLAAFADGFIVAFLIGVLVPGWIILSHRWGHSSSAIMLGTYGTVPCMVNISIHSYFVLRWLWSIFASTNKASCPHCHGALSVSRFWSHQIPATSAYERVVGDEVSENSSEESFKIALIEQENAADAEPASHDPRPSTDDETARLV